MILSVVVAVVLLVLGGATVIAASGSENDSTPTTAQATTTRSPITTTTEAPPTGDYSLSAVAHPCDLVPPNAMFAFVTSPPEEQTHEGKPPDSRGGGEIECDSEYATTGRATSPVATNMQLTVELSDTYTTSKENFDSRRERMQGADDNGPVPGVGTDAHSEANILANGHAVYYTIAAWDSNAYITLYVLVGDEHTPITRARMDSLFAPQVRNALNLMRG